MNNRKVPLIKAFIGDIDMDKLKEGSLETREEDLVKGLSVHVETYDMLPLSDSINQKTAQLTTCLIQFLKFSTIEKHYIEHNPLVDIELVEGGKDYVELGDIGDYEFILKNMPMLIPHYDDVIDSIEKELDLISL